MARKRANRINAKGRNADRIGRDAAVMILRRSVFQLPHESALSVAARALKLELLSLYNGRNNGELFLSVRDATDRLGFSDFRVASAAFEELQATGLISLTIKGLFVRAGEQSRACAWKLNWIGPDGKLLGPDEMLPLDLSRLSDKARKRLARRQAAIKRYHRDREAGKFSVAESTTLDGRRVVETTTTHSGTAEETPTLGGKNCGNASPGSVGDSTTHIDHHSRRAA